MIILARFRPLIRLSTYIRNKKGLESIESLYLRLTGHRSIPIETKGRVLIDCIKAGHRSNLEDTPRLAEFPRLQLWKF